MQEYFFPVYQSRAITHLWHYTTLKWRHMYQKVTSLIFCIFEMRENRQSFFEKTKVHNDTNYVIISSQKPKHNLTKIKSKLRQKHQS